MISFIVTGFGPFMDVKNNPTTVLATKLVNYLRERETQQENNSSRSLASSTRTLVIETSFEAAKKQVDILYDQLVKDMESTDGSSDDEHVVVLLHLGVHCGARHFLLETCAYNEADARIPDEQGYQPRNLPIVEGSAVGTPLRTLVDVHSLVDQLNNTHSDKKSTAVASTDPGRFVCNYTYCYSLGKFECSSLAERSPQTPSVRCLFLHVPPFSIVPEQEQLLFVANLMDALEQQVRNVREEANVAI
jgi:pyroglutamyl-peptidase